MVGWKEGCTGLNVEYLGNQDPHLKLEKQLAKKPSDSISYFLKKIHS